ncbi:MAG TPA: amino acid permease [Solirubrobacteraceae bacterium]|nr:amino acid permease [Solirubrobacteraceae bacterium]
MRLPDPPQTPLLVRRTVGSPVLFSIIWTSLASAIYFALGVIAGRALGLTPLVFLIAGGFFVLTAMTYVEGASLHQDRAGATVFARYAFDELWSFIAGWVVILDFLILVAVASLVAVNYAAVLYEPLGAGAWEVVGALAVIAYVTLRNVIGFSRRRFARVLVLVVADLALQVTIIVLGLILVFDAGTLIQPIDLGTSPPWSDVIFALTIATVAFTGLESASGLAGEVGVGRAGLKRLMGTAALAVPVLYAGIALVAVTALPVSGGRTALSTEFVEAPVAGLVTGFNPPWLADGLMYTVAVLATLTLVAAANAAMLGLSRLAYQLATNRQIPSAVGRLHPVRATPWVVIVIGASLAAVLVIPRDLEGLVGIYAFGALLAFLIAHVAIIRLRYKEPGRPRPYRVPLNVSIGQAEVPLPALLGAVVAAALFVSLLVFHEPARYVGVGWLAVGVVLYVIYRRAGGKPLRGRVIIAEEALRHEAPPVGFGSIMVPILGTPLDDDLIQTAGRLAAEDAADEAVGEEGAVIEAIWVFEVPMSLPLDARLPAERLEAARAALKRAKAVGEEYEGVTVQTATVRGRRAGQAIVEEARRRGVEVIVLGAEEPSRVRRGALLGGRGAMDDFVGEAIKQVVTRAPCRVILTAPPAGDADELRGDVPTDAPG